MWTATPRAFGEEEVFDDVSRPVSQCHTETYQTLTRSVSSWNNFYVPRDPSRKRFCLSPLLHVSNIGAVGEVFKRSQIAQGPEREDTTRAEPGGSSGR